MSKNESPERGKRALSEEEQRSLHSIVRERIIELSRPLKRSELIPLLNRFGITSTGRTFLRSQKYKTDGEKGYCSRLFDDELEGFAALVQANGPQGPTGVGLVRWAEWTAFCLSKGCWAFKLDKEAFQTHCGGNYDFIDEPPSPTLPPSPSRSSTMVENPEDCCCCDHQAQGPKAQAGKALMDVDPNRCASSVAKQPASPSTHLSLLATTGVQHATGNGTQPEPSPRPTPTPNEGPGLILSPFRLDDAQYPSSSWKANQPTSTPSSNESPVPPAPSPTGTGIVDPSAYNSDAGAKNEAKSMPSASSRKRNRHVEFAHCEQGRSADDPPSRGTLLIPDPPLQLASDIDKAAARRNGLDPAGARPLNIDEEIGHGLSVEQRNHFPSASVYPPPPVIPEAPKAQRTTNELAAGDPRPMSKGIPEFEITESELDQLFELHTNIRVRIRELGRLLQGTDLTPLLQCYGILHFDRPHALSLLLRKVVGNDGKTCYCSRLFPHELDDFAQGLQPKYGVRGATPVYSVPWAEWTAFCTSKGCWAFYAEKAAFRTHCGANYIVERDPHRRLAEPFSLSSRSP